MLVITRTVGESFRIGDDVVIEVKQTKGEAIKLGIATPKEVEVHRQEILSRLRAAQPRKMKLC